MCSHACDHMGNSKHMGAIEGQAGSLYLARALMIPRARAPQPSPCFLQLIVTRLHFSFSNSWEAEYLLQMSVC